MESCWRNHRGMKYRMVLIVFLTTTTVIYMLKYSSWHIPHQKYTSVPFAPVDSLEPGPDPAGYIMVRNYSGQQGSGVRALISLQHWAAHFQLPMHIVEPFVEGSQFVTELNSSDATNSVVRFRDLFDINHFNRISLERGLPPLMPWEHFIQHAPKHTIVVQHYGDEDHFKCLRIRSEVVDGIYEGQGSMQCSLNKKWLHNAELENAGLCVRRAVSAGLECIFVTEHIYKQIFNGFNPRNVVLLFNRWEAKWRAADVSELLDNHEIYSPLSLETFNDVRLNARQWLRPSPQLLSDAQQYTSMFLQGKANKIATMVRTEKLAYRALGMQEVTRCLQQTAELAKNLQLKHGGGGIFLSLDVGKYGTNSYTVYTDPKKYEQVIKSAKGMVHTLYDGQWNFEDWENSFSMATGGNENPGYIAALQRTIASQADCLILVGTGNFQQLALGKYLENHPKAVERCIHYVCIPKYQQNLYNNMISGFI